MGVKAFGARVTRFEDPALLSGRGRYVDDLAPQDVLHACFVRSPLPMRASVPSIRRRPRRCRTCVAVLTAADLPPPMNRERIPNLMPHPAAAHHAHAICAGGREVCFVGEAVAVVIARKRYARRGCGGASPGGLRSAAGGGRCRRRRWRTARRPRIRTFPTICAGAFTFEHGDADAAFASAPRMWSRTRFACIAAAACRSRRARFSRDPIR